MLNKGIRFFAAVTAKEKQGEWPDYEKENDRHCDPRVKEPRVRLIGYAKGPTQRSV